MFISIVLLLIAGILLITFWDWIQKQLFLQRNFQRALHHIEKKIILEKWKEAEKDLFPLLKMENSEARLLQIKVLRGTKRYGQGLELAQKMYLLYPEELGFLVEQAKLFLALGRHEEAFKAFRSAKPALNNEADILDYVESALLCQNLTAAVEILEPILAPLSNPGEALSSVNGRLLALAGDIFYEKKAFSEAIQWYTLAEEKGYATAESATKLAHAYRRFGNLAEAETLFRKVLEKDSGNISATLGLGACMQERGNHSKALLFLQAGEAWNKKDPQLLFQAGIAALHLQRFNYASAYFKEVIAQEGVNPKILLYYGYALEGQQLWKEAEKTYLELLHYFPNHESGYLALSWLFGVGLCKTLSEEEGIQYAYRALQLCPQPHTYEIVSACEARIGNFDKAHKIQEYLTSIDPQNRGRRLEVMRHLRKNLPLVDSQVQKALQKELVA